MLGDPVALMLCSPSYYLLFWAAVQSSAKCKSTAVLQVSVSLHVSFKEDKPTSSGPVTGRRFMLIN